MTKVLVIESTKFGYDGITNVIVNYYTYLDHSKIKMDIVTINEISEELTNRLTKNKDQNFIIPYRNSKPLSYIRELRRIVMQNGYDVVHVHGCSSTMLVEMLAATLAGVKVRIAHSHNTTCNHIILDKILNVFFLRLCNVRFACSEEAGRWLFKQKKFNVIANGIDMVKFMYNEAIRNEMRKKYKLEGKLVIGHVGRFSEQKNHHRLIEIFEELSMVSKDVKLVLVGDGELKDEIMDITGQKKLDVLYVGNSHEVEKWLQAMDIMVFPSLFEGLPLGIIEAQAAALPCVLSSTISSMVGITDLISFVDLDKSNKEWAEKILDIDISKRQRMKNEVEKQIRERNFDIRQNCIQLEKKYMQLAKGDPK